MHDEAADGLADLNADRAVGMGDNAVELREVDRADIPMEAARALTEGLDRRVDLQFMDDAEVDEADAAGAMRGDFRLRGPAIHHAPVVQHHVVDAIGHDRPAIAHHIGIGAVNREHTTGDLIRRARRNAAVAVDRIGLQPPHVEPAGLVAAAADKDAAAANRLAIATRRTADEIGTDPPAGILLHVPERERAVDDVDAVAVWAFFLAASIGRDDIKSIHIDVASAHLVAGENLNAAGRRDAAQFDPPETFDRGVVEDRAFVLGGVQANVVDTVVRRQLKAINTRGESDGRVFVFTP